MNARAIIEYEVARPRIPLFDGRGRPVDYTSYAITKTVQGHTGLVKLEDESIQILEMPEGQPGCVVFVGDDDREFDDLDEGVRFFMRQVAQHYRSP